MICKSAVFSNIRLSNRHKTSCFCFLCFLLQLTTPGEMIAEIPAEQARLTPALTQFIDFAMLPDMLRGESL
jgi:hypothetical protein